MAFNNPASSDSQDIFEKNQGPKEIRFFDPNYEELNPVITINCHIYYRNINFFVDQLKNVALLWLIEKT